jgi:hypothetical protein
VDLRAGEEITEREEQQHVFAVRSVETAGKGREHQEALDQHEHGRAAGKPEVGER